MEISDEERKLKETKNKGNAAFSQIINSKIKEKPIICEPACIVCKRVRIAGEKALTFEVVKWFIEHEINRPNRDVSKWFENSEPDPKKMRHSTFEGDRSNLNDSRDLSTKGNRSNLNDSRDPSIEDNRSNLRDSRNDETFMSIISAMMKTTKCTQTTKHTQATKREQ